MVGQWSLKGQGLVLFGFAPTEGSAWSKKLVPVDLPPGGPLAADNPWPFGPVKAGRLEMAEARY